MRNVFLQNTNQWKVHERVSKTKLGTRKPRLKWWPFIVQNPNQKKVKKKIRLSLKKMLLLVLPNFKIVSITPICVAKSWKFL